MSRFDRQIALPEVGPDGQAKLASAHVLVVGAGGLGNPVLQYLASAGVGEITVMDGDIVEESNLPRQPLFTATDIGRNKVDAARDRLHAMAPELRLHPHARDLTPDNAEQAIAQADVVVDAADSFAVSYTLSDQCQRLHKPLVSASALGQAGYVAAVCASVPSLRAIFPEPPCNSATCADAGIMGPVVGAIGSLQAQMVLKLLLDHSPSPLGHMIHVDMAQLQIGRFDFCDAVEPTSSIPFIGRNSLSSRDHVIDLRSTDEAPALVCTNAHRLLPEAVLTTDLPSDAPRIVLACRSGLRAWRTALALGPALAPRLALLAVGARG
ncbi:HesA/MoeB/ThiF family protein [Phaeobacter sp.]|uniref:HesA/MoeB/ThiF family protein n=1 Tax=Phaeobacter sp. TaxID=1902409 RepID=UPI0025E06A54|nr:HesA/MoeB/ThiF family protein [Phaeobacter sp.]